MWQPGSHGVVCIQLCLTHTCKLNNSLLHMCSPDILPVVTILYFIRLNFSMEFNTEGFQAPLFALHERTMTVESVLLHTNVLNIMSLTVKEMCYVHKINLSHINPWLIYPWLPPSRSPLWETISFPSESQQGNVVSSKTIKELYIGLHANLRHCQTVYNGLARLYPMTLLGWRELLIHICTKWHNVAIPSVPRPSIIPSGIKDSKKKLFLT